MNCPNCGAAVKDGKFCNYCGAKLPDDTKHIEVKIDKHVEDVAEIKRAEYESKESNVRVKLMKRELYGKRIKWSIIGILTVFSLIMILIGKSSIGFPVLFLLALYLIISFMKKILC